MDAMVTIRQERPGDVAAREALLDLAYGPVRFSKPSQRLREGRRPARELSFVAVDGGRIVGSLRLWQVSAGCPQPDLPRKREEEREGARCCSARSRSRPTPATAASARR